MSGRAPRQKDEYREMSVPGIQAVGVGATGHPADVPVGLEGWELCLGVKALSSSVPSTSRVGAK